MKYIITEGSFLKLVKNMVEESDPPKDIEENICRVEVGETENQGGRITITIILDSSSHDPEKPKHYNNLRKYYWELIQGHFGLTPLVYVEFENC